MTPVLPSRTPTEFSLRQPRPSDGTRLWECARDSRVLDLNSSYSYVLWCRDFAATSIVAADGDDVPIGFVTGYRRPEHPGTLFVWQVAVDAAHRGRGLAGLMLDALLDRTLPHGVRQLETTVSPDNAASIALFTSLARRRGTDIVTRDLFAPSHFPTTENGMHEAEDLYTVGPFVSDDTPGGHQ